jgi:hypothetical protein
MSIALSTAAAGSLVAGLLVAPADAGTSAPAQKRARSPYALLASGYGTKLIGGQVPAGSSQTSFTAFGCTTVTGITRENHEAEVAIPGGGKVSGIKTTIWSAKKGATYHSFSRSTIASVVLAQSGLGKVQIGAVRSLSHAFHNATGFHAVTRTSIGQLQFVPAGGAPQTLDLPTPGQPVTVPGLATISVGSSSRKVDGHGATANATTLKVDIIPSGTTLMVGHTAARALDGVKNGVFSGFSAATRASAADDHISSGRTPLTLMPCQGTGGRLLKKTVAHADLGDQIIVDGLHSQARGTQYAHKSVAMERGTVAKLDIGGGQLVISGVVGQANVTRPRTGRAHVSAKGTTVGTVTANGQQKSFPDTGPLEIPGVAKIQPRIVKRLKGGGIAVVAVRVTLLDGTGAVLDLGVAKARIRARR